MDTARRKDAEAAACDDELSIFRSLNGQLQWVGGRNHPDIAFEQNLLAQCVSRLAVADLLVANALTRHIKDSAGFHITIWHGVVNMDKAAVAMDGDSKLVHAACKRLAAGMLRGGR